MKKAKKRNVKSRKKSKFSKKRPIKKRTHVKVRTQAKNIKGKRVKAKRAGIKKQARVKKKSQLFTIARIILLVFLMSYVIYFFRAKEPNLYGGGELSTLLPFFSVLGILLVFIAFIVIKVIATKKDEQEELSPLVKQARRVMSRNPGLSVSGSN